MRNYDENLHTAYNESQFSNLYHWIIFGFIFLMAFINWIAGNFIFASTITIFGLISAYMLFRSIENKRNARIALEFERLDNLY